MNIHFKYFVTIVIWITIGTSAIFGQSHSSKFSDATLKLLDGKTINTGATQIDGDSITFSILNESRKQSLRLDEIYYIKIPAGTNAGKGALYGFAFGGGLVLGAALRITLDDQYVFKDNAATIYLGIIAGSTAIGGLIGAASKRYKTIYEPHLYFKQKKDTAYKLGLNFYGTGGSLVMTF